jgi:hypothetical protein
VEQVWQNLRVFPGCCSPERELKTPVLFYYLFFDMLEGMPNQMIVPKDLVIKYKKQHNLMNVADLLASLKKPKSLKDFATFCNENNFSPVNLKELPKSILFHGSSNKLRKLKPSASIGKDGEPEESDLVYATDDVNYAIFLAVLRLNSGSAGVDIVNKKAVLHVDLGFINGASKFKPGYIHVVAGDTFKKIKDAEYVKNDAADILFSVEVEFTDLTVPVYVKT